MGGWYCAINSPRGSGWGQKSRDWRSREFAPTSDRVVSLLRNTDRPCRFALYLGNHSYFSKAWQFLKTAKEYMDLGDRQRPLNQTCRYGDATTFTCDVIMVPVVTRAPNIMNISCWKIALKPLMYIDPRIPLNYYTFIPGKTIYD